MLMRRFVDLHKVVEQQKKFPLMKYIKSFGYEIGIVKIEMEIVGRSVGKTLYF